jgi:hypothetical protein
MLDSSKRHSHEHARNWRYTFIVWLVCIAFQEKMANPDMVNPSDHRGDLMA